MLSQEYKEAVRTVATVIGQEIVDVGQLMAAALVPGTRARTVFYKAAYNSAASIVEGFVYLIIIELYETKPEVFGSQNVTNVLCEISSKELGSDKKLFIGEKVTKPLTPRLLKDKFSDMNDFCKSSGAIDQKLFEKLDRIRKKRNQVHLQARTSTTRNYTRAQVDGVMQTAYQLLDVYMAI